MTDFGISSDDLQRLARLVEENGLSELRYEDAEIRVTLRTGSYPRSPAVAYAAPNAPTGTDVDGFEAEWTNTSSGGIVSPQTSPVSVSPRVRIEAPVMGVFYRSPAPGESSFIEVGDTVEVGQAIGMIEAMKVFSEVLAEAAGTVLEIPAKNGALVQPGDALVVLEEAG